MPLGDGVYCTKIQHHRMVAVSQSLRPTTGTSGVHPSAGAGAGAHQSSSKPSKPLLHPLRSRLDITHDLLLRTPAHQHDMSSASRAFWRPSVIFSIAVLVRAALLLYGRWQDAHSAIKYTDIDYLVFTDAARYVSRQRSPYDRATYRYTPLLAWLLLPTTWHGIWFEFGKALFAIGDVVTGWLTYRILRMQGLEAERSLKFASIWLLNPMVANISTRGSSEGLLAVLVVAMLWAALSKRILLAGSLLGLSVHFKIYPFIYAASIFWWLGCPEKPNSRGLPLLLHKLVALVNRDRILLITSSLAAFMACNVIMYHM